MSSSRDLTGVASPRIALHAIWFNIKQRPHHFVDVIDREGFAASIFSVKGLRRQGTPRLAPPHSLHPTRLLPQTLLPLQCVRNFNRSQHRKLLDDFLRDDAICHVYAAPPVAMSSTPQPGLLIYDCMDDWAAFDGADRDAVVSAETQLCVRADAIWVSSRALEDRLKPLYGEKVSLVPNAADYNHFAPVAARSRAGRKSQPSVGYVGAVADWFDLDLLIEVARQLPEWKVVIVGPVTLDARACKRLALSNIVMAGRQPYDNLPHMMATFDVGIIPFRISPLTMAVNPIKLFEYLAAGKPVVSTPLQEVLPFNEPGVVACAGGATEFATAIRRMASEGNPERCREVARQHSWQAVFSTALRGAFERRGRTYPAL